MCHGFRRNNHHVYTWKAPDRPSHATFTSCFRLAKWTTPTKRTLFRVATTHQQTTHQQHKPTTRTRTGTRTRTTTIERSMCSSSQNQNQQHKKTHMIQTTHQGSTLMPSTTKDKGTTNRGQTNKTHPRPFLQHFMTHSETETPTGRGTRVFWSFHSKTIKRMTR